MENKLDLEKIVEGEGIASKLMIAGMIPASFFPKVKDLEEAQKRAVVAAAVAIAYGSIVGLTPIEAMSMVTIIDAKPTIYGRGLALVMRKHPKLRDLRFVENIHEDGLPASIEVQITRTDSEEAYSFTYTRQEAQASGGWGKWITDGKGYVFDHMRWKALHRARNLYLPEAGSGFDVYEDASDWQIRKQEAVSGGGEKESSLSLLTPADVALYNKQIEEALNMPDDQAYPRLKDILDELGSFAWSATHRLAKDSIDGLMEKDGVEE